MSFLSPLYALAGLAIALPILFHLIRRRPKERILVSSLMFLEPTTPRLTRQSRIDQWFLLLLRATAVGLLALAFTRPYWNVPAEKDADQIGMQRMVLIDTSASMRREGIWKSAIERTQQIIRQFGETDAISVYQFDSTLRPLVGIESALETAASQRQTQAISSLQGLSPTWKHTDLGLALLTAADLLQTDRDTSSESRTTSSEIVVVTDFQNGSDLERLAQYAWPQSCRVRIERVESTTKGNAWASTMDAETSPANANDSSQSRVQNMPNNTSRTNEIDKVRVRVSNSSAAAGDKFRLSWLNDQFLPIEDSQTDCKVPAGSTLTVRMPAPPKGSSGLILEGDSSEFDNRFFTTRSEPISSTLLCVETARTDSDATLGYFLKQLPLSDPRRTIRFQSRNPGSSDPWPTPENAPLIVAAHQLTDSDLDGLMTYVEKGGHLLWAMDSGRGNANGDGNSAGEVTSGFDYSKVFQRVTGISDARITEAKVRQYGMLQSVDFKHPLFVDLADSKFNDFSKIRFWKHRRLESDQLEKWSVLAKFDDGSPALISKDQGAGHIWVLMAGWQPEESQLALSTKFVPLFMGLVRIATPIDVNSTDYRVGMKLSLAKEHRLLRHDGTEVSVDTNEGGQDRIVEFVEPGIYRRVNASGIETLLSVNLIESESNTSVGGIERLEKLGVLLTEQKPAKKDEATRRQLRAVELESQQGWWRWVLVGVVGMIGLESLFCIRKAN